MILTISFYSSISLSDCYSDMTQLNLLQDGLQILLNRLPNTNCDFPAGVMVQLQFADSTLNIGQIFTNFSYNDTNQLQISCNFCEKYENILLVQVLIDSPQLTTIINVGSILNIRKQRKHISKGVVFSYLSNKQCIVINSPDVGKSLTNKQVSLTIISDLYGVQEFSSFDVEFLDSTSSYCFDTNVIVDYINIIILQLSGLDNGILVSQSFSTSEIIIKNQPKIMDGIQSTVYNNFFFLGIVQVNPSYQDFIKTINTDNVTFVAKYIVDNINYYISGKVNPELLQVFGNVICDVTDNPISCKNIMMLVKNQPVSLRQQILYLHFGEDIIAQNITKWSVTCFKQMLIEFQRQKTIFDLTYELSSQQECALQDNQVVILNIGYFASINDFVNGINGFTQIQQSQIIWNNSLTSLIFPSTKHSNLFKYLKNQPYKGIFLTDINGTFIDQVLADKTQFNLKSYLLFYICMCYVISIISCLAAFYTSLLPRRVKQIRKVGFRDEI